VESESRIEDYLKEKMALPDYSYQQMGGKSWNNQKDTEPEGEWGVTLEDDYIPGFGRWLLKPFDVLKIREGRQSQQQLQTDLEKLLNDEAHFNHVAQQTFPKPSAWKLRRYVDRHIVHILAILQREVARKKPVRGGKKKAESLQKKFLMSEIAPHEMDFDGYKVFLKQLFTEMNTAFQKAVQNLPPPPPPPPAQAPPPPPPDHLR